MSETANAKMLIDDFQRADVATVGTPWRSTSDRVMGGVSIARLERGTFDGRAGLRLTGDVSLENNGGFVQMGLDLAPGGATLDGSGHAGVSLVVRGNGERYGVHLRTVDCLRPWQSYRAGFLSEADWREVRLPFDAFEPHRLDAPLDRSHLRRLGVVAIGRAFAADVMVSKVMLYR